MSDARTGVVDFDDPARNMYGCLPCPKCGDNHRAAFKAKDGGREVVCDACDFREPAVLIEDEP